MKIMNLSIFIVVLFCITSCASSEVRKKDLYVDQTLQSGISSVSAPTSTPHASQAGFDQDPSGS